MSTNKELAGRVPLVRLKMPELENHDNQGVLDVAA